MGRDTVAEGLRRRIDGVLDLILRLADTMGRAGIRPGLLPIPVPLPARADRRRPRVARPAPSRCGHRDR